MKLFKTLKDRLVSLYFRLHMHYFLFRPFSRLLHDLWTKYSYAEAKMMITKLRFKIAKYPEGHSIAEALYDVLNLTEVLLTARHEFNVGLVQVMQAPPAERQAQFAALVANLQKAELAARQIAQDFEKAAKVPAPVS
jgi:hypothetical protein